MLLLDYPISAGETEKLPGWANTSAWSYDMEGHARKCVERYCELVNKKTEQLQSFSSLFGRSTNQKRQELENKGELPEVCSHVKRLALGTNWST